MLLSGNIFQDTDPGKGFRSSTFILIPTPMKYIKDKDGNTNLPSRQADNEDKINLPGYPLYPVSEDIYNKYQEEENIDPEDTSKLKVINEEDDSGTENEEDRMAAGSDDVSGDDLDVPGSELDDDDEKVGSEDEENNYYSLGGDNHNDLEEDNGE